MKKNDKKFYSFIMIIIAGIYFGLYKDITIAKAILYIWTCGYSAISILGCFQLHSIMRKRKISMLNWKTEVRVYKDDFRRFLALFMIAVTVFILQHYILAFIFVLNWITGLVYRERKYKIRKYVNIKSRTYLFDPNWDIREEDKK